MWSQQEIPQRIPFMMHHLYTITSSKQWWRFHGGHNSNGACTYCLETNSSCWFHMFLEWITVTSEWQWNTVDLWLLYFKAAVRLDGRSNGRWHPAQWVCKCHLWRGRRESCSGNWRIGCNNRVLANSSRSWYCNWSRRIKFQGRSILLVEGSVPSCMRTEKTPTGGWLSVYKKNQVYTKLCHLPPFPCKVCGSGNHWDRECPNWDAYNTEKHQVNHTGTSELEEYLLNKAYQLAYSILMNEKLSQINDQDFHKVFPASAFKLAKQECKTEKRIKEQSMKPTQSHPHVSVEEVENEKWKIPQHGYATRAAILEEIEHLSNKKSRFNPPISMPIRIICISLVQLKKAGMSSIGISVLSVKGKVGSLHNDHIDW